MELQKKLHFGKSIENSREVVERLVEENLTNKLDKYLKKFDKKSDVEGILDFHIDKNKTGRFNGKLHLSIDGKVYIYSREDYKNLDDLINHLFDHLKEEFSSK